MWKGSPKFLSKSIKSEYTIPLTEGKRIAVEFTSRKGEVTKYSVCYMEKGDAEWEVVKRCDNAHKERGLPGKQGMRGHCHLYDVDSSGKLCDLVTLLGKGKPGEQMTAVIEELKDNYDTLSRLRKGVVEKSKRRQGK